MLRGSILIFVGILSVVLLRSDLSWVVRELKHFLHIKQTGKLM
jgi:hypothetical protein